MKKLLYTFSLLLISTQLFASHGMGGEITWVCQGNSYVFKVKFYRDCNGITPSPISLSTNVPGVPSIPCPLISQTDISPTGSSTSGNMPCSTCPQGNFGNPIPGLVEEYVYQSAPTVLPGTPPAGGWAFWWGECCRSNALTNISGGGSLGFALRAKMYPYAGFVAGQCKDNSPFFAEKPSTIICTGYPYTYNHNAVDPELDSIVYSWDSPIDDVAYPWTPPIPFAPGYSTTSQMPGPIQNGSNIPAAINSITGEITYTSFTQGYFATVIKVQAFKCGVLAAEIWREINVVLIANCVIPPTNVPNNPPVPTPPFPDPITGFPNQSYDRIAYAGDTVRFTLPATDGDPHPVLGVQSITFNASGGEFGAGFINPAAGCFIPPCATLSPPPPVGPVIFGTQVTFMWPVKCQHMGLDTNCTTISNVYNFVLRINDNYCPANGIKVATISITVKRPPKLLPPRLKCVSVLNLSGDVELSWAPPAPRDTHYTFAQYEIWASLTGIAGSYVKLDSVYGGLNKYYETNLVIPAAKQMAVLGTHAQNQSLYFQMFTRCGCDSDSISIASNMARSMKTNAVQAGSSVDVTWNPVHNPLLATSHNKYYIYKEFPIGTWTLIDSTTHPDFNYTDPTTNIICDDTLTYRIQTSDDSLMCTSWSSFAGIRVINAAPIATITPNNPLFCVGDSVTLSANVGGSSYQWSGGSTATTQSINATTSGTYTVTVTYMPGGCTSTASTVVNTCLPGTSTLSLSGPGVVCPGSPATLTITCAGIGIGTCGGTGPYSYTYLDVTNNILHGPFVTNSFPVSFTVNPIVTTTYQLVSVTTPNSLCGITILGPPIVISVLATPTATIVGNPIICNGQQANISVNFGGAPGPYAFMYNPGGILVNTSSNPHVITISPTSTTNYTLVSVSAACPGSVSGQATVTVNPLPTAQLSGTQTICAGQQANLNINFTGTGPWTYSYFAGATLVGPLVSAVNPAVVAVNPAATTTYSLPPSITDANCTGTVTSGSATVTVNALPTAQISGSTTVCDGTPATLTINFTGVAPFNYSYTDGTTIFGPSITSNNSVTIPVSPSVTTTYQMSLPLTGAGCNGNVAGSASITVNQLPTAAITGTNTICDGAVTNLTVTFANAPGPYTYSYTDGTTVFGPFNTGSNPAVFPVSPNVNTTYTLTSISNMNCPGSVTGAAAVVTVTPLPTATLSGATDICIGQSTNLTVTFTGQAPFTYSYLSGATVNGPFTTSTNPEIISVSPGSTTNYALTGTLTGNGCAGSISGTALITVNPLPTASISGTPTICAGQQTDLNITFTGTAPFTYRYTDGVTTFGPFTTSNNPEIITVSPPTTRNFTVTTVNDVNCTGTTSGQATVTVNPLPTAQITGTATICDGDQTNLTINFTGTAPFIYIYSDGTNAFGPFNTNNNSVTIPVSPGATTTYSVTSIDDDNCTGTTSGSAVVTVNPLPTAALSGNPTICNGQNASLSVNFTGTAPFVFSYTDGTTIFGPITTSANPATVTVSPLVTTNYNLTATVTGAGCTGSTSGSASVTVNQLPTATVSGVSTICNGDQSSFNISFTGAQPFTYTYSNGSAAFGPFTTSNANEIIAVSPNVTTTYTVSIISDDNCTGTASGQAVVTVHPLPTAQISGTTGICDGSSTSLSINFTGTGPYTYSYNDGTITYGPFTTNNDPETITVQPAITTTYSVTSIGDANCVGTVSGSATVTVYSIPSALISDNSAICIGGSTSFKITFFNGTAPFTYRYSDGISTFGPFNTSNNPQVVNVSPSSTKTYSLVSINDVHCPGTVAGTAVVTVNSLPVPVITGNNVICDGNNTIFDAGAGYSIYQWSTGDNTQTITVNTAGPYSVIVTDINGCSNSTSRTLTVNETPVVSFTNDTSMTCEAPIIHFANTSTYPAGSTFQWDFGDAVQSTLENPSHLYALPGIYPITLIITTQHGCADTLTRDVDIQFYPLAEALFTPNPTVASVFNSSVNFVDQSQYAVTWNWDFGDGFQSGEPNPKHYYDEIGKYKIVLTVTNIAGCPDRYEQEVLITPFFIPNAFTPNGDGKNDLFFDTGYIMDVASYNMTIFSRWGQKVFENDDYRKFWSGYDKNGNKLPQGVYAYLVKVKTLTGKPYEYAGTVTLVR